jgi:hypothetical protein
MLKIIESNTIDPTEFAIVETIIKLVKYGVKSHNGIWAQNNNTKQDVYMLTSELSSKTLKEINLILKNVLRLEVDSHFVLRSYPAETVELSDHLADIVDNIFGHAIYEVRDKLESNDFYHRCCIIHDIVIKNISYVDSDILDILEAEV